MPATILASFVGFRSSAAPSPRLVASVWCCAVRDAVTGVWRYGVWDACATRRLRP
jgi:hypothetical protein